MTPIMSSHGSSKLPLEPPRSRSSDSKPLAILASADDKPFKIHYFLLVPLLVLIGLIEAR